MMFKIKDISFALAVLIMSFLIGYFVFAWVDPPIGATPPEGNVPGPLNVSSAGQLKEGGLILNTGGAVTGLIVQHGNVGIGTTTIEEKLHVDGRVRLGADPVHSMDAVTKRYLEQYVVDHCPPNGGGETVPPAPTGISCSPISSSQIDVSWNSVSGATGYKVYRCTGTTCTPTTLVQTQSGTFWSSTGLTANTSYRYRVLAYNSVGDGSYSTITTCTTQVASFTCGQNLTDIRDGNVYPTVQIGTQCWLGKNLIYSGNGCLDNLWTSWHPYNACRINLFNSWGTEMHYQWDAAMNGSELAGAQGVCPSGWHVPTDEEWKILERSLGMTHYQSDLMGFRGTNEGQKLKSTNPSWNGTNAVGFDAKPASYRSATSGGQLVDGTAAYFTNSNLDYGTNNHWLRELISADSRINRGTGSRANGYSVRCLRN